MAFHPVLGAKRADLSGQRFSSLVVVCPIEVRKNGHVSFECLCDCGTRVVVTNSNLKSQHTQSCGCLQRELTGRANRKHGMARHPLYRVWRQMNERCHREGAANYKWYGARGIYVCERWRRSFEAFRDDMGTRPPGHWIEREDNDGPYSPENCSWKRPADQARNTSRNRFVTFQGRTQTVSDWERELNLRSDCLGKRLRSGKTVEEAMSIRGIQA